MAESKAKTQVDYEINKSLDELVSEDQSMRHHGKGKDSQQGNSGHSRGGSRGGRFSNNRGGNEDRDYSNNKPSHASFERRGGHHNNSGRHMRDEREVPAVEQRDAYGKNVEGRRLFVSNLAFETQWKYLKDHMRQAGDVVRADIFEHKDGTSRGIGLVEFRSKGDAQRALARLHETMLDGRKLYLKEDSEGHIFPPLQSKKEFGAYNGPPGSFRDRGSFDEGHRGARGSRGMRPSYRRSRSRSRSISGSPARSGRDESRPRRSKHGSSRDANPEQANSEPRRLTIQKRGQRQSERESSSEARKTYSIHVSNLPYSVDRDQLRGAFVEFGKVLHSSVSLDERGNSRGFGVVEYETREAAESAVLNMDKASFNGREVTVKGYDLN